MRRILMMLWPVALVMAVMEFGVMGALGATGSRGDSRRPRSARNQPSRSARRQRPALQPERKGECRAPGPILRHNRPRR